MFLLLRFSCPHGRRFSPLFTGAKFQDFDFFVRLLPGPGFFLAQSKSSRKARTTGQSLTVEHLSRERLTVLAEMPAPVYLLGVDSNSSDAFVVAVNRPPTSGTRTIRTDFPLDSQANLALLYDEVLAFWGKARSMLPEHETAFPLWVDSVSEVKDEATHDSN